MDEYRINEFNQFYNTNILPELIRLEKKRISLISKIVLSILLFILVLLLGIKLDFLLYFLIFALILGLYIYYLYYQVQKFILTFKPRIVNIILDFIDDKAQYGELTYKATAKIPFNIFRNSQIFIANPSVYDGEDYINGSIGNVKFQLSELNVREPSKVRQRLNYIFEGVFIEITTPNHVDGQVLLLPKHLRQYLTRTIKYFIAKDGQKQKSDNLLQEFSNIWDIYIKNQPRLGKILPLIAQQQLIKFNQNQDYDIYIHIQENKLYIALANSIDILQPKIWKSNKNFDRIKIFSTQLTQIFSIIEIIESNNVR